MKLSTPEVESGYNSGYRRGVEKALESWESARQP